MYTGIQQAQKVGISLHGIFQTLPASSKKSLFNVSDIVPSLPNKNFLNQILFSLPEIKMGRLEIKWKNAVIPSLKKKNNNNNNQLGSIDRQEV